MLIWIKKWAQGIVIAVIIATILEMLLPDNKNKKYINTVIGIYILFSIISPVISKFTGSSIKIEDYFDKNTSIATEYTFKNITLLENSSNVEDVYIKTLKENITKELKKYNYKVNSIELKISTESEKNFGEILGIYLHISTLDEHNNISAVDEIKIDIQKNEVESKKLSSISEGQKNQIKEILMDIYGIDKNKIYIN